MAKKSDYSVFINFFFNSLKNRIIHYFLGPYYSLFITCIFLAHYSLFIIKKGLYSLIIIPHPDPHSMYLILTLCIRIYHECEGGIEKSILRITIWHHEASQVMIKGDRKGTIFLSNPHTNNFEPDTILANGYR